MIHGAQVFKLFLCLFLTCTLFAGLNTDSFCDESKAHHSESSHEGSEPLDEGHCFHQCIGSVLFFSETTDIILLGSQIHYQHLELIVHSKSDFESLFKPPIA